MLVCLISPATCDAYEQTLRKTRVLPQQTLHHRTLQPMQHGFSLTRRLRGRSNLEVFATAGTSSLCACKNFSAQQSHLMFVLNARPHSRFGRTRAIPGVQTGRHGQTCGRTSPE